LPTTKMVDVTSGNSLLFLIKKIDYHNTVSTVVKQVQTHKVVYITFNKTGDFLMEEFSKKGLSVDNVFFVDAISKSLRKTAKRKNQYFVSSPAAFDEIINIVNQLLVRGYDQIILDSLTNLLVYQNKPQVRSFITSLIAATKKRGARILLYALLKDEHQNLINAVSKKVDRIIDYSE